MNKVQVDSVIKRYRNRHLLEDIYLSCTTGEIIALLGNNGAGKSTLFKIIVGLVSADQKYVSLNGNKLGKFYNVSNNIKYLPQHPFLPSHVKVGESIKLMCEPAVIKNVQQCHLVKEHLDKYPNNLSGGQKRIIKLLMILHSKSDFLLLEEPFSTIDPIHVEEIKSYILEASKTKGIILTDHNYEYVLEISSSILLLKDAAIIQIQNKAELNWHRYLPAVK